MSEQCKKLEGLDFNATYIGKDSSENDLIEKAEFDFIYGSPEQFVGDLKWRSVLKSSQFQKKNESYSRWRGSYCYSMVN